jgi:hypothetical protein
MVCQLRPLLYSLGLNIAPRTCFMLEKSRVKNIRRFKLGASRCKMAGTGFHCFAKIRALFHRGVEFCTAECSKCFISFGLNYTTVVSVDTPSRDTVPLTTFCKLVVRSFSKQDQGYSSQIYSG